MTDKEICEEAFEMAKELRGKTASQIRFLSNVVKQGWCSEKQAAVIENIKMQINEIGIYSKASRRDAKRMFRYTSYDYPEAQTDGYY